MYQQNVGVKVGIALELPSAGPRAAVLAHAGIYRTFGFMAKEQSRLRVDSGHGSTRAITSQLLEAMNDGSEQSLIPGKAYSREAVLALRKVVDSLNS
jgi:VanZ family protein